MPRPVHESFHRGPWYCSDARVDRKDEGVMDRTVRGAQEDHGCQRGTRVTGSNKKKCRVVHVNIIKPYHQPDCRILRVMVVAEDPEELPLKPVLASDQLMEPQTTQLQQILEGSEGTFRDEPGLTTGCEHHIKTGDALPIRSVPYAISPKKLEGVRKEISSLLKKGIIVPSTSQWSSPIMPLIKPD